MCQHTNGIIADQRKPRSAEELKKAADELKKKKREEMQFLKDTVR